MFKKEKDENQEFEILEKSNNSNLAKIEESDKKMQKMMHQLNESNIKQTITSKMKEIDSVYQKDVLAYTENIHRYNMEIEQLRNEIYLEEKKSEKEEKLLLEMNKYIEFKCKDLESLNQKFAQKVKSIAELKTEYKTVMAEEVYTSTLLRKELEIFEFVDEIEELELSLLNKELQQINLSKNLEPKQENLEELRVSLKELQQKKAYFESIGLHKSSPFEIENKVLENKMDTKNIVDTEVLDQTNEE